MLDTIRLRNLIVMLGYDNSCSKVLISMLEEHRYVDVNYMVKKTGYSRSMISYIMKKLNENGILLKKRMGHKYIYNLNEKFLLNIYSSFIRRLERELKYISDERSKISDEIYNQINIIKENIKNLKGEIKWQRL